VDVETADEVVAPGRRGPGAEVAFQPLDTLSNVRSGSVSCRPAEVERDRGEVDRSDPPPGGGEPDRLGSVPASRIEGEAWLHGPDLREQESIRRPTRHLLRALAQGLSPAPFPGALVKRLIRHDTTRSGLLNATCCDRAIAPNERGTPPRGQHARAARGPPFGTIRGVSLRLPTRRGRRWTGADSLDCSGAAMSRSSSSHSASRRLRRHPPSTLIGRATILTGYGTTKGGGEQRPHAPPTVLAVDTGASPAADCGEHRLCR
jgi:hypothetical protein